MWIILEQTIVTTYTIHLNLSTFKVLCVLTRTLTIPGDLPPCNPMPDWGREVAAGSHYTTHSTISPAGLYWKDGGQQDVRQVMARRKHNAVGHKKTNTNSNIIFQTHPSPNDSLLFFQNKNREKERPYISIYQPTTPKLKKPLISISPSNRPTYKPFKKVQPYIFVSPPPSQEAQSLDSVLHKVKKSNRRQSLISAKPSLARARPIPISFLPSFSSPTSGAGGMTAGQPLTILPVLLAGLARLK